jgi:serine protease Do
MGVSIRPITPEDAEDAKLSEIRGVVVNEFNPPDDSPAKRAGILEGDIITSVDGQGIESVAQLQQRVGFKKPGDVVQVTVVRKGGVKKTIPVRLTAAPSSEPEEISSNTSDGGSSRDSAPMESTLGISVEPLTQENARDPSLRQVMRSGGGLVVSQTSPDGPAYGRLADPSSGLNPDIIVKVNGTAVASRAELRRALAGVKKGDIVTLTVLSSTQDGWQQRVVRLRAS